MLDLDIRLDTELRDRANTAVDDFINAHGTPVSRAQIAGLLQIAGNEADLISKFAGNQKDRAQKRREGMRDNDPKAERFQDEIDFWTLVVNLCEGVGSQHEWSLKQQREKEMPGEFQCKKPHPSAPREERDNYERTRAKQKAWERQWNRDHFPGFFRHFCAQYLYRMPPERGS